MDRNWIGFSVGIEIAIFVLGVETDFVFVCMPVVMSFSSMDRNSLGFGAGIAIDLYFWCRAKMSCFNVTLFSFEESKLTCFMYTGRKSLDSSVRIEINFVLVWVVEIGLILMSGIELDFISVQGSWLTWFLCGGRKWLGFTVWIEISFVLVSRHQNWLELRVGNNI